MGWTETDGDEDLGWSRWLALSCFVRLPRVLEGTNAKLISIGGMKCKHDVVWRMVCGYSGRECSRESVGEEEQEECTASTNDGRASNLISEVARQHESTANK